jgi:hypothetical protein
MRAPVQPLSIAAAPALARGPMYSSPPGGGLRDSAAAGTRADAILGGYLDGEGRRREVLAQSGPAGSLLVVDRDRSSRGDRRLVAHLPPDEPAANAELVCRHYLHDAPRRRCRRVTAEDIGIAPFASEEDELMEMAGASMEVLFDHEGHAYRLERLAGAPFVAQLRWRRHPVRPGAVAPVAVSVREVIGALESYAPVRAATVAALLRHRGRRDISVGRLRAELDRVNASPIVLNRCLRSAVLARVRTEGVSLSEIAIRCGRVKYDARGNLSGETSWLSRRVGLAPEGGGGATTPWIHSEVLALIARAGLNLSPREVEVD